MFENTLNKMASIPSDKLSHSFYGTLIYAIVRPFSKHIAILVVIALAILKEVYDYFHPKHTADYKDAIATIFIALLLYLGDTL